MSHLLSSFVWQKMGTEAGETLGDIIRRKEIERRVGGGLFTWGVGSSLKGSIKQYMQDCGQPMAVFTPMKSRAKPKDEKPERILLWRGCRDNDGNPYSPEKPLPEYSFPISGVSGKGVKKHYALLCQCNEDITAQERGRLNSEALVNYLPIDGRHKKVDGRQTTAVVKNMEGDLSDGDYAIKFTSPLVGAGQVVLTDSVEITIAERDAVMAAAKAGDIEKWKMLVTVLKRME